MSDTTNTTPIQTRPDYYKITIPNATFTDDVGPATAVIEVVDIIKAKNLDFFLGNALKYLIRAGQKPGQSAVDDLTKLVTYAQLALDNANAKTPSLEAAVERYFDGEKNIKHGASNALLVDELRKNPGVIKPVEARDLKDALRFTHEGEDYVFWGVSQIAHHRALGKLRFADETLAMHTHNGVTNVLLPGQDVNNSLAPAKAPGLTLRDLDDLDVQARQISKERDLLLKRNDKLANDARASEEIAASTIRDLKEQNATLTQVAKESAQYVLDLAKALDVYDEERVVDLEYTIDTIRNDAIDEIKKLYEGIKTRDAGRRGEQAELKVLREKVETVQELALLVHDLTKALGLDTSTAHHPEDLRREAIKQLSELQALKSLDTGGEIEKTNPETIEEPIKPATIPLTQQALTPEEEDMTFVVIDKRPSESATVRAVTAASYWMTKPNVRHEARRFRLKSDVRDLLLTERIVTMTKAIKACETDQISSLFD